MFFPTPVPVLMMSRDGCFKAESLCRKKYKAMRLHAAIIMINRNRSGVTNPRTASLHKIYEDMQTI